MSNHKSLVAFTLLVQSAVGSTWCVGIALLLGDTQYRYGGHAVVALLLVLAGLCFSVGHLGRPGACFYAVRNLKYSWLSREIAATVTLAASATAMAFYSLRPGGLSGWVVFATSAIGGFSLYAMTRAYRLRTVPSWNHVGTRLDFLGSTLLLGGLQFTVVSDALRAALGPGCGFAGPCVSGHAGFFVALVGFLLKLQSQSPKRTQAKEAGMLRGFSQPILQGSGIVLWMASIMSETNPGLGRSVLLLAAAFLVIGEITRRIHFYDTYRSAGF